MTPTPDWMRAICFLRTKGEVENNKQGFKPLFLCLPFEQSLQHTLGYEHRDYLSTTTFLICFCSCFLSVLFVCCVLKWMDLFVVLPRSKTNHPPFLLFPSLRSTRLNYSIFCVCEHSSLCQTFPCLRRKSVNE